jgi:uncharacterized protein YfaP (DUF2135 family)
MTRALALLLLLSATPERPEKIEPPKVRLLAPRPGWTRQRLATIQGTVSDKRITVAHVGMGGLDVPVNVQGGRFEAKLVLPPGEVTVEVSARNEAGPGRDAVTLFSAAPAPDVLVLLTWDTAGTDLDLHVTDPSGEECDYGNRRTASGGALEVDDTDGYGPEIFAQDHAPPGVYQVAVAAYDVSFAAQTHAEVLAVVRPFTAAERRYRFRVAFTREDENIAVGSFRVEAAGP